MYRKPQTNISLPAITVFLSSEGSRFSKASNPSGAAGRSQAYQEQSSLILSAQAVWQVLGGMNTEGSLMPSCMSKNRVDKITL